MNHSVDEALKMDLLSPPVMDESHCGEQTLFSDTIIKINNGESFDTNKGTVQDPIVESNLHSKSPEISNNPVINIVRPTSATPSSQSPSQTSTSNKRRFSTYVRPTIESEPFGRGGSNPRTGPRRSSISIIGGGGKLLSPSSALKDVDYPSPIPSQFNRSRRISFGLGGVPKAGYWGAGAKVDTDSDSVDSLLEPTSRKHSRTFQIRGPTLMGYNRRQWHYLVIFALVDFCSALVISIQGPIYPEEAERHNVTATEYGLVFGVFELTMLVMSPVFGKLLGKISPQALFNGGIFVTSICVILFGFLDDVEDVATFLTLSFILRIFEASGDAACMSAAYQIITAEFPDTVSTTFIFLRTFFGIGLFLGPLIGASMYNLGGFSLPFVVLGTLLFSSAILACFLNPKPNSDAVESSGEEQKEKNKPTTGFLTLLKSPTVVLAAFSIIASSISIGFLNPSLEPHIREFTSSKTTVCLIFTLNGCFYSLSSPLWSWGSHLTDPKYITLIGATLTFTGFLLIGPAPFIPINTCLWLTCVGLIIQGLGVGATFVSGFLLALRDTIAKGYPDDECTYGIVMSLYTVLFAVGNSIGPSVSGLLDDYFGFRCGTVFVLILHAALVFLVLIFILCDKLRGDPEAYSDFDDESFSALHVSAESIDDEWEDVNKDGSQVPSYGATISNSI